MTDARVATVDVYVLRRRANAWDVLLLQRASGVRCTGAWEAVHGMIEAGERPEDAAIREVMEETGLKLDRLYNVTVQPFYLHTLSTVTLAIAFAGVVANGELRLSGEHSSGEWLTIDEAMRRVTWPRSRTALADIAAILASGDAGAIEDVLRIL